MTVRKRDKEGRLLQKPVPYGDLEKLNRPERKNRFSEAKDFTQLYRTIEASGGLKGSDKFYEVNELKEIINEVRHGILSLDHVTQTEGLRKRVAELLEIEEMEKEMKRRK